jgi:hypothetical protein
MAMLALGACDRGALPVAGDGGGASDSDLGRVCVPTCAQCSSGACCGNSCCAAGEWCDPATLTCRCGSVAACRPGQWCGRSGPIQAGDSCGTICCGAGIICAF